MLGTVLFLHALLCQGCYVPSKTDEAKLAQIQKRFGGKYRFSFEEDVYLRMEQTTDACCVDRDAEEAYKTFFFNDYGNRARSGVGCVYLNVYGPNRRFLFQLCYDRQLDRIVRENTHEYY